MGQFIQNVLTEVEQLGIYIDAVEMNTILPDPKDSVFYEVVMEKRKAEDAYLVTGNVLRKAANGLKKLEL